MRCSFGVCQCHGIEHPVGILAKIIEGPFAGLPLWTEARAQVGKGGIVVSFMSLTLRPLEVISCANAEMPTKEKQTTVSEQQNINLIRIVRPPLSFL